MKSAGTASNDCAVAVHGRAAPLVAAHDQAFDLLPVVDEQVRVAQRRQRAGPGGEERLGDDVLVRHRHDRHPDADEAGDLGGEHAAAVDHHLALDVAAVGAHPRHPAPVSVVIAVTRVRCAILAPPARADAASA